jgi:peptidoglycan/LPS O-acetylase OafA/YrhL/lysophospholipase L1-like esterase
MPGLDGLRALAVLAVIAFHEELAWAPGGLLGVGVFFTLSGYLITDLLLGQWAARARLALADFWARRARRLLPALFVMLIVVSAWITVGDRARLAGLRGSVVAAATYWSNWYLIDQKQSYFARFAPAAPLDHLWSLAVEEQFYLAWPWLLLLGLVCLRLVRRSSPPGVAWLALPTLLLAAASTVAMLVLYHPGFDPTRVYEGTDTRAGGLLIGAALAMAWPSRSAGSRARTVPGHAQTGALIARRSGVLSPRTALDCAAFAGLIVIAMMIWRTGQYSPFLYRGGLVLLSVATAAVIAATATPGTVAGRALGWMPLRWLGVRSYGVYLWHYPVIVLTTPANSAEDLARAGWQTLVTIILAALSWHFVEQPVRKGAIGRLWARARSPQHMPRPGLAAAAGAVTVIAIACVGLATAAPAPASGTGTASLAAGSALPPPPSASQTAGHSPASGQSAGHAPGGSGDSATGGASPAGQPATGTADQKSAGSASAAAQAGEAASPAMSATLSPDISPIPGPSPIPVPQTSCRAVAHIGDSTSEGMVSPDYLPDPTQRLAAQYQDVGVQQVLTNIVGANSVVETLPGDVNGYKAARGIAAGGFSGCWVIALGTNDTADVAIGSNVGEAARIQEMMSAAHGQPVMWVDVVSVLNSGPYAAANMQAWNGALRQACSQYPNMRVFDWAAMAQPDWFINDGIHYTSAGYAIRGQAIAYALAKAFPAKGHSHGCMIS